MVPKSCNKSFTDRHFQSVESRRLERHRHSTGEAHLATLESTAFLALGFGGPSMDRFRMRRDPLGCFIVLESAVSRARWREHGSCNHAELFFQ